MIIEVDVSNKIAQVRDRTIVGVCGNSDYVVHFNFDDEWSAYETKTARFKWNGEYTDVVFTGNECPMPIIYDTNTLEIGVYAGELHTTTAAVLYMKKSVLCGNGVEATNSNLLVSNEVIDAMNKANAQQIDAVQKIVNDGYEAVLNAIQNIFGKTETVLCTFSASDIDENGEARTELSQKVEINSDTVIIFRVSTNSVTSNMETYLFDPSYNMYANDIIGVQVMIGYIYDADTSSAVASNSVEFSYMGESSFPYDTLEVIKVDYSKISVEYLRTTDIDNAVIAAANEVRSL